MNEDKVIQEKINGSKASWEIPETGNSSETAPDSHLTNNDSATGVPSNYENTGRTYSDPMFEVQKAPGRLG